MRTRVGYAGGTTLNPTYLNLGDHTETIQLDFDPAVISYPALLEIFWASHDPTLRKTTQYMSRIFYHTENQRVEAVLSMQEQERKLSRSIYTEIVPYLAFYIAEDYHQKYYLRQNSLLGAEYAAIYPQASRLVNSTAAARVNGFAGGNGTRAGLQALIDRLGLSEQGKDELLRLARR